MEEISPTTPRMVTPGINPWRVALWAVTCFAALTFPALWVKFSAQFQDTMWNWTWDAIVMVVVFEPVMFMLDKERRKPPKITSGSEETLQVTRWPALLSKKNMPFIAVGLGCAVLVHWLQSSTFLKSRAYDAIWLGLGFWVVLPCAISRFGSVSRWFLSAGHSRELTTASPPETPITTNRHLEKPKEKEVVIVPPLIEVGTDELLYDLEEFQRRMNIAIIELGLDRVAIVPKLQTSGDAMVLQTMSAIITFSFVYLELIRPEWIDSYWLMCAIAAELFVLLGWLYSLQTVGRGGNFRIAALYCYLAILMYTPVFISGWMATVDGSSLMTNIAVFLTCQMYTVACECVGEHILGPCLQARFVFVAQVCGYVFPYIWMTPQPNEVNFFVSLFLFHAHNGLYSAGYYRDAWVWFLRKTKLDATISSESTTVAHNDVERNELVQMFYVLHSNYALKIFCHDGVADIVALLALPILSKYYSDFPIRVGLLMGVRCVFWPISLWLFLRKIRPAYAQLDALAASPRKLVDLLCRELYNRHYELGHIAVLLHAYVDEFPQLFRHAVIPIVEESSSSLSSSEPSLSSPPPPPELPDFLIKPPEHARFPSYSIPISMLNELMPAKRISATSPLPPPLLPRHVSIQRTETMSVNLRTRFALLFVRGSIWLRYMSVSQHIVYFVAAAIYILTLATHICPLGNNVCV